MGIEIGRGVGIGRSGEMVGESEDVKVGDGVEGTQKFGHWGLGGVR